MKASIHPTWFPEAKVVCACGNSFAVGATVPELNVEVCYNCHPFYTGTLKLMDAGGRIDAFNAKLKARDVTAVSKTEKRKAKRLKKIQEEMERPETLEELRKSTDTKK